VRSDLNSGDETASATAAVAAVGATGVVLSASPLPEATAVPSLGLSLMCTAAAATSVPGGSAPLLRAFAQAGKLASNWRANEYNSTSSVLVFWVSLPLSEAGS